MNNTVTVKPTISIDFKNHLIRIHKQTLYLLGRPEYIQLLVNPADKAIALLPGIRTDNLVHRINWDMIKCSKSCELHSKSLVLAIKQICRDINNYRIYRLYGELISGRNMAVFPMNKNSEV